MDESDEGRDADDVEVFERPPGVGMDWIWKRIKPDWYLHLLCD